MLPEKNTIQSYFRAIKRKDISNLVDMFEDEAVIHEPFSKEVQLRGKLDFRRFFQVICMAIEELKHDLLIEEDATDENGLSVLCTFQRGETVCARFSFQFGPNSRLNTNGVMKRKIQKLQIQFLNLILLQVISAENDIINYGDKIWSTQAIHGNFNTTNITSAFDGNGRVVENGGTTISDSITIAWIVYMKTLTTTSPL